MSVPPAPCRQPLRSVSIPLPVREAPPPHTARLLLAPMEGMADCVMRDVLTRIGGYDQAVSEFVRVSGWVLPARTFLRLAPELAQGSRTAAGTPLAVQLLGSDPELLALSARRLAGLQPWSVDLNFGCPAKVVNRHGGGAMLLDEPELMLRIVQAVRAAVPAAIPVTAKMRLGVADTHRAVECALALQEGGAASVVVHARTRDQGYRPPAHWEWVARIGEHMLRPLVANGEVWTVADWQRCREISATRDVMLGRGAIADPWLARRIRGLADPQPSPADWLALLPHLARYWEGVRRRVVPLHAGGRLKMWLKLLCRTWPQAEELHAAIRPLRHADEVGRVLQAYLLAHAAAIPVEASAGDHGFDPQRPAWGEALAG